MALTASGMHPIFDSLRFPFGNPQAENLFIKLFSIFYHIPDIQLKYQKYGPDLPPLNFTQSPRDLWMQILDDFTRAGLIKGFCEGMIQEVPIHPQLKEALNDVIHAQSVVREEFIAEKIIVLDRKGLREQLELLSDPDHPLNVLLVRGESKSGKSYGRHVFLTLAREKGAKKVYLSLDNIATLQEAFEILFTNVADGGHFEVPPMDSTEEAWYGTVCRKLMQMAMKNKVCLWIAIDDLGGDTGALVLDSKIKHFFDQFVLQMSNPSFSDFFRLMLIHYPDGKTPSRWRQEIWNEDRTSQQDIQQSHVESVLKAWCAKNGVNMTEEQRAKYARDVIIGAEQPLPETEAEEEPRSRIERIHLGVQQLFKNLLNPVA